MAALVGRNVVVILGHVMDQLLGPDQLPGTARDSAAQRPGQQLYQRLCVESVDISSIVRTTQLQLSVHIGYGHERVKNIRHLSQDMKFKYALHLACGAEIINFISRFTFRSETDLGLL